MFDLPTETRQERRAATRFRSLLLDRGFMMMQYSVYVKYSPTLWGNRQALAALEQETPVKGRIRILVLSDHQWQTSFHLCDGQRDDGFTEKPGTLTLF